MIEDVIYIDLPINFHFPLTAVMLVYRRVALDLQTYLSFGDAKGYPEQAMPAMPAMPAASLAVTKDAGRRRETGGFSRHWSRSIDQWEFQDPKMEVLYHISDIRAYFLGIFPYIGLI